MSAIDRVKEALQAWSDGLSTSQSELLAYGIFGSYFGVIFLSFALVLMSILDGVSWKKLLEGRAFFFLRAATASLGVTWYLMISFMQWSYRDFALRRAPASIGQWLLNTQLFEQAWGEVCSSPAKWWWSSFICTWTVILTAVIWRESAVRKIRYPWAYMILGMSVAISVATALFICATFLHPRIPIREQLVRRAPLRLYVPLLLSMFTVFVTPTTVGTDQFLSNVLWMHGFLVFPLLLVPDPQQVQLDASHKKDGKTDQTESTTNRSGNTDKVYDKQEQTDEALQPIFGLPFPALYTILTFISIAIHALITLTLRNSLPPRLSLAQHLFTTLIAHPAQGSISSDVVCVFLILFSWWLVTGSFTSIVLKSLLVAPVAVVSATRVLGANWKLIASLIPLVLMLGVGVTMLGISSLRSRNARRRKEVLEGMGIRENTVEPGTDKVPPKKVGRRLIVGFWHPYCNAGGGGERVLWAAIAYMQRTQPKTVFLVYSGDYPKASKEAILQRAEDRFSIRINPNTLTFVPLPSRYLIDDGYWSRFTLLGQSLGSVYLAYQGLCGKEGVWGDVFIDTMGHGFTFPFVRLIAGASITTGAYIHYPTVSTDMVKRVREGLVGVESAGKEVGGWKRQVKLAYYHIFTSLYATSLLFSETIMTNSSWTQAHIQALLSKGKSSWLAGLLLMDDLTEKKRVERGETVVERTCEVVFPPCDTDGLVGFGLGKGGKRMVSLAQFRPEKEHSKQLYALKELFDRYPQYRSEEGQGFKLTLMGGVRDDCDQKRLDGLKTLASELGVEEHVEFLINAPYAEVVDRLGRASIGLNTMQDEHFGINVVEFMAAGLIPIVHASAGPKLDIVVPQGGQTTGYHGTDAASFAEAIHTALSLSEKDQTKIRKAARDRAAKVFSTGEFERKWRDNWQRVEGKVKERVRAIGNEESFEL